MMSLADAVHAATFLSVPGLKWVKDPFALRTSLRRAQRFMLDAEASRTVADFSLAIVGSSHDLNPARELARSPFSSLWVDVDNRARLGRIRERGIPLTSNASFDPVHRTGWLIERHHQQPSAHRATHFTSLAPQAMSKDFVEYAVMAPICYAWDSEGKDCPWERWRLGGGLGYIDSPEFLLGMEEVSCSSVWAIPGHCDTKSECSLERQYVNEMMAELRHIFGFLVAINCLGSVKPALALDAKQRVYGEPREVRGRKLEPLAHREVVLRLHPMATTQTVVARAYRSLGKRRHDVRGHWRFYRFPDGSIRRRAWVRDHERGDEALGRIVHDRYHVVRKRPEAAGGRDEPGSTGG